ncbi:MAG: hypothetical protein QOG15_1899 [Solirubrobacteraceae bacterium]|jgi:hypothetical protein|nr:hypothetical protein [Solirubrobacteraceae bacterium]
MPDGQIEEILALGIVFVVHIIGGIMLVWGILGDEGAGPWWRWWRRGDDGDDPPRDPDPPGGGERALPVADAASSRVRLREDARIADGYPRTPRRPEHPVPAPAPSRPRD